MEAGVGISERLRVQYLLVQIEEPRESFSVGSTCSKWASQLIPREPPHSPL